MRGIKTRDESWQLKGEKSELLLIGGLVPPLGASLSDVGFLLVIYEQFDKSSGMQRLPEPSWIKLLCLEFKSGW